MPRRVGRFFPVRPPNSSSEGVRLEGFAEFILRDFRGREHGFRRQSSLFLRQLNAFFRKWAAFASVGGGCPGDAILKRLLPMMSGVFRRCVPTVFGFCRRAAPTTATLRLCAS